MSKFEKGLKAALQAARRSEFYSHRVGAAVFIGSRLISMGHNKHKSHPKNRCWSQHAEFDSLIHLVGENLSRAILFVARLTRTDKVSCAKPCEICQEFINQFNIRRVFYTNHKGELEQLDN